MTLGFNNKSKCYLHTSRKQTKLLPVRSQIRAKSRMSEPTHPFKLLPLSRGPVGAGRRVPQPQPDLSAPPAEPEEGPSGDWQVSRGSGDLCRPQRQPEDPRRRAGPLGPAGTPWTPPQLR
ncbi:uncharacterized protein LOC113937865 [Zalophus californianus]|uniref:Uncharacterized protein LOC113937865 n=1 Tax=Zalophus californianus TaxID=9704 RepID=A0A6J2FES0_ZALCA|nr:uncharacterized protein LOC113937865 [Zalophus californianus]